MIIFELLRISIVYCIYLIIIDNYQVYLSTIKYISHTDCHIRAVDISHFFSIQSTLSFYIYLQLSFSHVHDISLFPSMILHCCFHPHSFFTFFILTFETVLSEFELLPKHSKYDLNILARRQ